MLIEMSSCPAGYSVFFQSKGKDVETSRLEAGR